MGPDGSRVARVSLSVAGIDAVDIVAYTVAVGIKRFEIDFVETVGKRYCLLYKLVGQRRAVAARIIGSLPADSDRTIYLELWVVFILRSEAVIVVDRAACAMLRKSFFVEEAVVVGSRVGHDAVVCELRVGELHQNHAYIMLSEGWHRADAHDMRRSLRVQLITFCVSSSSA